jgi:hypothetical protein
MMKAFAGAIAAATIMSLCVLGTIRAEAACSPPFAANSPAPGTTVTCSSANAATYGDGTQNGLTINVLSGAFVSSATASGMNLGSDNAVNNSGQVQSTATLGIAINSSGALSVVNSGTINGVKSAISTFPGPLSVVNTATGTITSGGFTIQSGGDISLTNAGVIFGSSSGSGAEAVSAVGNLNLTNTGTIASAGFLSDTIFVQGDGTIVNSGTITNTGTFTNVPGYGAIIIGGTGTVINTGTINSNMVAIVFASGGSSLTNSGAISGSAIKFTGTGNTLTLLPGSNITAAVNGGGTIRSNWAGPGRRRSMPPRWAPNMWASAPSTRSAHRPGS